MQLPHILSYEEVSTKIVFPVSKSYTDGDKYDIPLNV